MRNFEMRSMKAHSFALLLSSTLVAACATAQQGTPSVSTTMPLACSSLQATQSAQQAEQTAQLRHNVESEKLFTLQAASGVASCTIQYEESATRLDYQFKSGSSLTVKNDPTIEYMEQSAQFTSPSSIDLIALLKDVEQHAFGPQGCGIDWQHGSIETGEGGAATDTVYRGSACNCQGRLRRVPQSDIVKLVLRSTC